MGVCLALCQIDHDNIVGRGLPALNHAIKTGDLSSLRKVLGSLPFDENPMLVKVYRDRVAQLKKLKAPQVIIESQQRHLARLSRPAPDVIRKAPLEEIRELLGRWSAESRCLDLDKSWDLIHWYCDGNRRRRTEGDWRWPKVIAKPSFMDYALHGKEPYPLACDGQPVIKTGGMPDSSWYNPPADVAKIGDAISDVAMAKWEEIDARIDTTKRPPYGSIGQDRLEYAKESFPRLKAFYVSAAKRGFGVSVEFY